MKDQSVQTSIRLRLELQFAFLSAAGGLVLASGQGTEWLAVFAVFAAAFGFVFVDWLRLFELPPLGAYIGMGAAAIYCVRDFWGPQNEGTPQMVSVALLLVLVQTVLMLQRKSRRILEQLAVFCLLELIVAAIFSDAISFGLLILPIGVIGGSALCLLGWVALIESGEVNESQHVASGQFASRYSLSHGDEGPKIEATPEHSAGSLLRMSSACARYAVLTLTPAVIVVAAAFFYVLPRKVEAERAQPSGPALTGFDDEIRLEQLGRVMQNSTRALMIKLTEIESNQPYELSDSLYLRGKVLEKYQTEIKRGRPVSKWTSVEKGLKVSRRPLPRQFRPRSVSDRKFYDSVQVEVTCESMNRPALFAIAPYYASGSAKEVVHTDRSWCLSREFEMDPPPFPRVRYRFGTTAFFRGSQTPWLAVPGRWMDLLNYSDLLIYDRSTVPSAASLAAEVVSAMPKENRSQYAKAKQLEAFLSRDPRFRYTLDLNAVPQEGVDPIEQFLATDRRGHCQYYASALAMMLRSQSIPCRVVVGYRTEEYNSIGKYYVARQQHAHAWVEALIESSEIPDNVVIVGQPNTHRYWLRLDPTPGASFEDEDAGSVSEIFGLANNLWEDYVVEMNAERQNSGLGEASGLKDAQASSQGFVESLYSIITEIRAGRLRGGALSPNATSPLRTISILLACGIALALLVVTILIVLRLLPRLMQQRVQQSLESVPAVPALKFYADALDQLARLGIERRFDETPSEFESRLAPDFPSLSVLTDRFLRIRFGSDEDTTDEAGSQALRELTVAVDSIANHR
ncbi:MAG: transglutaminaseTgpA domain-containing protein [Planctomycetota bacterium]